MIAQLSSHYIRARPWKVWSRLIGYSLFEGRPVTTRGRWINPLVLTWLRAASRLPRTRLVDRPIFIIGTGRSGTTMLGLLLSVHRDVGFLNEPKALWHVLRPDEDVIGNYTRGPGRFRLGVEDATPDVVDAAHRIFGVYLSTTGSRRLLDKYPELIFRTSFIRAIFPDARFLFVTRNGWDTCRSVGRWSERLGTGTGVAREDWWGVNRRKWRLMVDELVSRDSLLHDHEGSIRTLETDTDLAAVEWVVTMREGLRLMRDDPERIHHVRYEELASKDPAPVLRRILTFCELPEDGAVLEYARETLVPADSAESIDLAPVILPAFNTTMEELGYRAPSVGAGRPVS